MSWAPKLHDSIDTRCVRNLVGERQRPPSGLGARSWDAAEGLDRPNHAARTHLWGEPSRVSGSHSRSGASRHVLSPSGYRWEITRSGRVPGTRFSGLWTEHEASKVPSLKREIQGCAHIAVRFPLSPLVQLLCVSFLLLTTFRQTMATVRPPVSCVP